MRRTCLPSTLRLTPVIHESTLATPCCMDQRCGRTEPDPCSGSYDADVFRASQLQHSVRHVGCDGYLGRLSPVRLRTQPLADDALPTRDIALHESDISRWKRVIGE